MLTREVMVVIGASASAVYWMLTMIEQELSISKEITEILFLNEGKRLFHKRSKYQRL